MAMTVEVVNTGTELLLGHTLNTHLGFLAHELFPFGLRIGRQITVPDGPAIRDAMADALARADVVFVTGGLGPTTDDITRETAADLLGLPLVRDDRVMAAIADRFVHRGLPLPPRNERQAMVPAGATPLANPNGTAPGLYLRIEAADPGDPVRHLFLLPGPPRELCPMVRDRVVPLLREICPPPAGTAMRTWSVAGLGESRVEELVGAALEAIPAMELGYCARPGEVEVRCLGPAAAIARAGEIIRSTLGEHLVADDGRSLEQVVIGLLAARGETLAVAESCTGGAIANRLTDVPGASAVVVAGFVTYANRAKTDLLGVEPALVERHGAVSEPVAAAMAEGALRAAGANWALAATGIAGPAGGTPAKPVGTVFLALAGRGRETRVEHRRFVADRATFKRLASLAALDLLRRATR